jgi:prepilin-type N-terminal cleavage/methylation domain-containing protein
MFRAIQRAREEESGFTLIELLIVIVILGILAGVVIFSVGGVTDTGAVAACKTDLKTVQVAVEAYKAKNGSFPPNLDPALTVGADQFLRPQAGLAANTLAQTQSGYNIVYTPATGDVTASAVC